MTGRVQILIHMCLCHVDAMPCHYFFYMFHTARAYTFIALLRFNYYVRIARPFIIIIVYDYNPKSEANKNVLHILV